MVKKLVSSLFLVFALSAYSEISAPKSYEIKYMHSLGNIDGFVQIPKGGQFDTTSERRPTFNELGVKRISYPELSLKTKWDRLALNLNAKYEYFKGSSSYLKNDLLTHDILVPEGSSIKTKHKYAYYGLGISYDFPLYSNLVITPSLTETLFDFSYEFSAKDKNGNVIAVNDSRKFKSAITVLGLAANYSLNDKINFILSFNTNIPMKNSIKTYMESSFITSYNLYKNENREVNLLAGISYEKLKFRDSQKDMQNYMKHTVSPTFKLGLEYKF